MQYPYAEYGHKQYQYQPLAQEVAFESPHNAVLPFEMLFLNLIDQIVILLSLIHI